MPAMEIIGGLATAPSTTFTAVTMFTGNSNTVRNTNDDSDILLLNAWADNQAAGDLRIRSPRLHDNVQGIRLGVAASEVMPLLPMPPAQKLISQDTLTVELTGSATGGDIETAILLLYYANLPGISARFIDRAELMQRMLYYESFDNTISTGTAGGWSGEETIIAEMDNLKANTDYALVGYQVQGAECAAVRWRGADSGNLGVGGPGSLEQKQLTGNWFALLSDAFGIPLIPVFNSANKNSILVDAAQDENGADPVVTTIFAQLAS